MIKGNDKNIAVKCGQLFKVEKSDVQVALMTLTVNFTWKNIIYNGSAFTSNSAHA